MSRIARWTATALLLLSFAGPAEAVDGVVLITQAKAINGNVTPGDAPGFPVSITRPGSYRLASNLSPGTDKDGVVVTVPDVTIDFNGFVLSGGPAGGTSNSWTGIRGQADRLTVRNGKINSFEEDGIYYMSLNFLVVENMRMIYNRTAISNAGGSFARIQNNTIALNSYHGVFCGYSCHVEGNVISGNAQTGVILINGSVLGNTIQDNKSYGIFSADHADVGFGNNTLVNNGTQIFNAFPLQPNRCLPAC